MISDEDEDDDAIHIKHLQLRSKHSKNVDIQVINPVSRDYTVSMFNRYNKVYNKFGTLQEILPPMIPEDLNSFTKFTKLMRSDLDVFVDAAMAEPI